MNKPLTISKSVFLAARACPTIVLASLLCSVLPAYVVAQHPKEITNTIGMQLVLIPKGTFIMGSPQNEEGRYEPERQHEVTISQDYYLGAHEVTQAQYQKVMGNNPSAFQRAQVGGDTSNHPVESVSWKDAVEFCKRLSELPEEKSSVRVYRLPTEAEWEYACRAGSGSAYFFGDSAESLGNYAWCRKNSGDRVFSTSDRFEAARFAGGFDTTGEFLDANRCRTHPVGRKKPNAWGLYDMHGNVGEYIADWFGDYPESAVSDPKGPPKGQRHVARGGSVWYEDRFFRSAYRSTMGTHQTGFRVALSPTENNDSSDSTK